MSVESLAAKIPDFAKDLKLNLTSILRQTELSEQQLWGTISACAMATENDVIISELVPEAQEHLSAEAFQASLTAASLMGMNNVYYRFGHLSSNENYLKLPAKLRMNGVRNHGIEQTDFELWSLAVSAINACGLCIDSHEKMLKEHGVSEEAMLTSVRVGAILKGISTALCGASYS